MKAFDTSIRSNKHGAKPVPASAYTQTLTFWGLEDLCDDPKRNESGQEVRAVLTPHRAGYALSARDGDISYEIIDDRGRQVSFRTIDQAIERLTDVPHLFPEIIIDTAQAALRH